MAKFRKKPVVIEAVQFTGDNWAEMHAFTGHVTTNEGRYDAFQEMNDDTKQYHLDFNYKADVWDKLHSTWVHVAPGMWIIRGVQGELYPCAPDVFEETYERVED